MHKVVQLLVVFGVLALVGWLRMPFEQKLTKQLELEHILTPSFDLKSRASLSQKGFVTSFGSLRPTLAAVAALGSSKHHSGNDWRAMEETFEQVVLLDPYNTYYWDLGAWHMAFNASTFFRENEELPPLTRERRFREWTQNGSDFYDRGIAANPNDLSLRRAKARLWTSPQRTKDFPLAAQTLEGALAEIELTPRQRMRVKYDLFYTLLRIPERVNEAYKLGRELYAESPENHFPSLLNGLTALQMHPRVKVSEPLSLAQLYGSRENALKMLTNYSSDISGEKPMYGVRELLDRLEHK